MKVLLVTSRLTYMPRNYLGLFESLLAAVPELIHGLVLLDNVDHKVLKSIIGLPLLGAHHLFKELALNMLSLPRRERENFFYREQKAIYQLKTMNSKAALEIVQKEKIDLIVNLRTRDIYRADILKAPSYGCLNIHHGLLPKYRGTMCDLYALSEGREAGFSIHVMNQKVDAGEIYKVQTVDSGSERHYVNYLARTASVEGQALAEVLKKIAHSVATTGQLPAGMPNQSHDKKYTRNPTREMVREMKRKGMIL